ncbi:metal-dependent transcriptional regulator [Mucilaginibacter paludis]|uniref:Transcriptional regulator MntR n=1 Tax=Mucilaginibacter paludis DSM 18603 TaxID=714943 RepID=H1Y0U9_9SPHI|nr:metal-dependent transcriptional regulator [Mucilaginibacter paludis]EHQ29174.1 iron (metal) dependent repressor, DtxR family [Mucilaginibacter paludis DSM 18603]
MNSYTEENYLKAIYHLSLTNDKSVTTNSIAAAMSTKAASVTDMLKKLAEKKLINYERYQGVSLTAEGKTIAIKIVRKHRLWEFFLVEKLQFKWDEVHELAEELEHIKSAELIERLDKFLGFPKYDPHGDPIPDVNGRFNINELKPVSTLLVNDGGIIMGVREHLPQFLQYLEKMRLIIGNKITVTDIAAYDQSVQLKLNDNETVNISRDVAKNILVKYD